LPNEYLRLRPAEKGIDGLVIDLQPENFLTEKRFTTTTGPKISSFHSSSSTEMFVMTVGGKKLPFEKSKPSNSEIPDMGSPPLRIVPLVRSTIPSIRWEWWDEMTVPIEDFGFNADEIKFVNC
jgi:hypothetical protein